MKFGELRNAYALCEVESGEADPVPAYLKGYLRRLDRNLNQMRSVAVYYREYSSIENLQLLGENYIKQMKRDLTPLTFQTSILCQRIGIAKDGFYSSMREGHKYNASDFGFLDEKFKSGEWSVERILMLRTARRPSPPSARHSPLANRTRMSIRLLRFASVWTTMPISTGLWLGSRVD